MKLNAYQKSAITTVLATFFLIFVGGLVRASGAGLGCPDWPKCFGLWIPPLSVEALPAGFDASQFNVVKTWTEYINRLIGVFIGLLIVITAALSMRYRKQKPSIFYASVAAFILVLVQGWLGGQVVRSGLSEWLITIHMMLAMVIVSVLMFAVFKANEERFKVSLSDEARQKLLWAGGLLLGLTLIQLVLGTQVREAVDIIKNVAQPPPRSEWLSKVGIIFEIHRSFSWLIFFAGGVLWYLIPKFDLTGVIKKEIYWVVALILSQLIVGLGLSYLNMAAVFQVLHLTGVALLIGAELLLILTAAFTKNELFAKVSPEVYSEKV